MLLQVCFLYMDCELLMHLKSRSLQVNVQKAYFLTDLFKPKSMSPALMYPHKVSILIRKAEEAASIFIRG